jgi:hypothetical protein
MIYAYYHPIVERRMKTLEEMEVKLRVHQMDFGNT